MDTKKQRNISSILKLILIILTFAAFTSYANAVEFKSKFKFRFSLSEEYIIFNNLNLYDVYNSSHKDPLIKAKIEKFKEMLKTQDIELLYNFYNQPLNNISILVFNENYKINKKKVLKQCKKILKLEKKIGKRMVDLKECRMHDEPKFADWSMYRENESSFTEGATTQQIIFLYKKKEYVITSNCLQKCNKAKNDLFNLVKSIEF